MGLKKNTSHDVPYLLRCIRPANFDNVFDDDIFNDDIFDDDIFNDDIFNDDDAVGMLPGQHDGPGVYGGLRRSHGGLRGAAA